MITRTVKEIAEMSEGVLTNEAFEGRLVKGVSTDSRKLAKDQLFIPLAGERFNGHVLQSRLFRKASQPCCGTGANRILRKGSRSF